MIGNAKRAQGPETTGAKMTIKNSPSKTKALWAFLLVIGGVLLYPFESTVVPARSVLVVTEDEHPIQDVVVRQIWQNYSIESEGHEEDLRSDENGRVSFPERTVRASVPRRILQPILNVVRQGVHASFGVHTDMFALGDLTGKRIGQNRVEVRPGDVVFQLR